MQWKVPIEYVCLEYTTVLFLVCGCNLSLSLLVIFLTIMNGTQSDGNPFKNEEEEEDVVVGESIITDTAVPTKSKSLTSKLIRLVHTPKKKSKSPSSSKPVIPTIPIAAPPVVESSSPNTSTSTSTSSVHHHHHRRTMSEPLPYDRDETIKQLKDSLIRAPPADKLLEKKDPHSVLFSPRDLKPEDNPIQTHRNPTPPQSPKYDASQELTSKSKEESPKDSKAKNKKKDKEKESKKPLMVDIGMEDSTAVKLTKVIALLEQMVQENQRTHESLNKVERDLKLFSTLLNQQEENHTKTIEHLRTQHESLATLQTDNIKLKEVHIRNLNLQLHQLTEDYRVVVMKYESERQLNAAIIESVEKKGKAVQIQYFNTDNGQNKEQSKKKV